MANLYDIHGEMLQLLETGFDEECIDRETGEILFDKATVRLNSLELEESAKIENTALYIKDLSSDIDSIKAEEERLASRRKAKKNKLEWLRAYLSEYLILSGRNKFETSKCALSFRRSEKLDYTDEEATRRYAEEHGYLKVKEPELDGTAIKAAIKAGEQIPGAVIKENQNLQIK